MRIGAVLLLVWLVIGAIAGGQRHYYSSWLTPNCARTGTIIATVLTGPLQLLRREPESILQNTAAELVPWRCAAFP